MGNIYSSKGAIVKRSDHYICNFVFKRILNMILKLIYAKA